MTAGTGNGGLVAGIGSALVDILIHEEEPFLASAGLPKGGMVLVDGPRLETVLRSGSGKPVIVPGGSACNTVIGVARLGGSARFVGKRGEDELGGVFEAALQRSGVEAVLFTSELPTGRVLSIITPDAQRSMLTYLGAAAENRPEEISPQCFSGAAIVHIEGYLSFNPDLMRAAIQSAKAAGARISLDLASYTVVASAKALLETIVHNDVDILVANEDEARAFTGYSEEDKALAGLAEAVDIAALKLGKRGSCIASGGETVRVAAQGTGHAVDTTGAGDLWASGFLYGLVNGWPLKRCGELGSLCGYEVCQVTGASIPEAGWERIRAAVADRSI